MEQIQEPLFARLGGIDMVHKTIDRFYELVLQDDTVNHFFENSNMDIQRGKMKAFLLMAMGGPFKFTGKNIKDAHTHLVRSGLNDRHFDAVAEHLDKALEEFNVEMDVREQISQLVENVRDLVLNR